MARQIGPTVEILLRRVWQEGGLAVDPDFATEIYGRCEQVINAHTKRVISSDTLSLPKERLLFNLQEEFSDAVEIISLRDSTGRGITKCDNLVALSAYDIDWFRKVDGTRVEAWCPLNRDLFVVYPGLASAGTLSIEYVTLITLYTDFTLAYNEDSQLPSEDIEMALKLAEIVLLARLRQLSGANKRIENFIDVYKMRQVG